MNKKLHSTLFLCLIAGLVCSVLPCFASAYSPVAAEYYDNYSTIIKLYNVDGCTGMQGMTVDDRYLYNVKVNSATEDAAFIARTDKDTGSTDYLTDSSSGSKYFSYFGHANDLELETIAGVDTMFIATSTDGNYSLVRMALNGTTLTKIGNYTTTYNGTATAISSAKVMSHNDTDITLLIKKGKHLYTTTLGVNATSGTLVLNHVFTLDTANVTVDGVCYDFSDYLGQGFEYIDGKIFVPMACADPMNKGCIVVYHIEGASGTIRNDPTLSFWIESSTYASKFELESCAICPTDGVLYFNTNAAVTSSDADHDGIHYVTDYVYDPSRWTKDVANYRWETQNDTLTSVQTGGSRWNNALIHTGQITDGTYHDAQYALPRSIRLEHDKPWILEWKSSGNWGSGALLFSSASVSKYEGNTYLFRRQNSTLIALGQYSGGTFHNYGVNISDYGIDSSAEHIYTMRNKIFTDGSNMVYLWVDGKELGPMNNYHIAGNSQGTTSDWLDGKDFVFSYMGTSQHPLSDCNISYIQVWGNGLADQYPQSNIYRWETEQDTLTSCSDVGFLQNDAALLNGSCSDGLYTDAQLELTRPVTLLHDRSWCIEWRSEGAWSGGAMLLASAVHDETTNAPFLYRRQNSTLIAFGTYDGAKYQNCGIDLSQHGIDGTIDHTYRLSNLVAADGSNMVYLSVDGVTLGAMNNYYIGGTSQESTSDWLNGQDFTFSYLGTYQMPLNDCSLKYLQIWENTIPSEDTPDHYRWNTESDQLTSQSGNTYTHNNAYTLSGSCSDGQYTGSHFVLERPVYLLHDRPWSVEWASSGSWKDNANGTLLLCSALNGNDADTIYLYRRSNSEIIAFGERLNGKHHNYGIKLSDHGIDGTAYHTYRLVNRIEGDGSNMIYLCIDGVELGAMNHYYIGGTSQDTISDWVSGKDFMFSYLGASEFHIGNCALEYLDIQESSTGIVEFRDWDGTVLSKNEYALGQTVTIPDAPYRAADQTYSYKFIGWDQDVTPCQGNAVYTAVYESSFIEYTVMFKNWDGSILSSNTYHYGDSVSEPPEPVRSDDDLYTYQFAQWDSPVIACTSDAVYTAQFTAIKKLYPKISPKYPTLSFEDEILIDVYFATTDMEDVPLSDMGLIVWSTPQTIGTIDNAEGVTWGATYNTDNSLLCVSTPGIPAKNIGDMVYFKIFAKLSDGTYIYSNLLDYSPKTYAANMLADEANSTELRALVVSMLNYGAQAQVYFNYRPYNLVNKDLTDSQKALNMAYSPSMMEPIQALPEEKTVNFRNNGGYLSRYPSIIFEGNFSIDYYFTPSQLPVGDIVMYYWFQCDSDFAQVLTYDNASDAIKMTKEEEEEEEHYSAVVNGIAAKDLDQAVYVAFCYSDGSVDYCSGILGYSIGAYCTSQANADDPIAPFAAATAVYGYYAKQLFT